MYNHDWSIALRTGFTYCFVNRLFRHNYRLLMIILCIFSVLIFFYYTHNNSSLSKNYANSYSYMHRRNCPFIDNNISKFLAYSYNSTYPLTAPTLSHSGSIVYRIGMVADLDINSKMTNNGFKTWRSYYKKGQLMYNPYKTEIKVEWSIDLPLILDTNYALKERGMELSELVTFNGKILTFDDRTGLIYELFNDKPIPWIILMDGNSRNTKGFKSEWATVKDSTLYVGSMGKEWTTSGGDFENINPMFIKLILPSGAVQSLDWSENYKRLRHRSADIIWPGYMIHESSVWSTIHQKWFFLPRRCSHEKYNETRDEYMGCSLLITADEQFEHIETVSLNFGSSKRTRGVSSFKFIPNTNDRIIVAIRSEEVNGHTATFITAFDIEGKILLDEQIIDSQYKYEGFEFI